MSWWTLEVRAAAYVREDVGAWLVVHSGQAIEEREDGALVAFADSDARAEALGAGLVAQFGTGLRIARAPVEPVDWSTRWRDGIVARQFGRIFLRPSWIDAAVPAGCEEIVLDPETAFGSGEHGSTRACLVLLDRHVRPGDAVLDLGSGSGILAIAAVRLGAVRAVGLEIDEESNPVAERNAARNGVADRTRFLLGDAAAMAPLLGPADLVCSNILRIVNVTMLDAIARATRPGGVVLFSGMEQDEAPLFLPELARRAWQVVDEATDGSWWAVAARPA